MILPANVIYCCGYKNEMFDIDYYNCTSINNSYLITEKRGINFIDSPRR